MSVSAVCAVPTAHAARYLAQLCGHWRHKLAVEMEGDRARVTLLNDAAVTLAASPSALEVAIRAETPDDMAAAKDTVARHLDRFGFREAPLTFDWREAEG
jgi:hypothetical protein